TPRHATVGCTRRTSLRRIQESRPERKRIGVRPPFRTASAPRFDVAHGCLRTATIEKNRSLRIGSKAGSSVLALLSCERRRFGVDNRTASRGGSTVALSEPAGGKISAA